MAHTHSIIDTDKRFSIDPVSRLVKSELDKITLAQNDHNSERFTFEIPRVEGHNMSLCDKVEIHFVNQSTATTEKSEGVYSVEDVEVISADDVVIFSWLISEDATKYAGTLKFLVRFVCMDGEKTTYVWSTAIFKGITIVEGM